MVIIMKPGTKNEDIEALAETFRAQGLDVGITHGIGCTILGLVGDTTELDMDKISMEDNVERVMRVTEPYKKANRKYHPEDTVIELSNGRSVGGNRLAVIAGPCSVESEAQIVGVAQAVKASGAAALRGGAFKPRTSPYAFRVWATTASACSRRQRRPPACPSSPRSCPPTTWRCSRCAWT